MGFFRFMAQALYTPTDSDLAFADVPVANVRSAAAVFDPREFTTIPNIPVFSEHETQCTAGKYKGRHLVFDYDALLAVCQRCNRRIAETGDYATIVIGHTPPRELIYQGKAKMPPVIGFVGPWRMGHIRLADGNRKWSIFADFHVFNDKKKLLREYPRRSAELWLEERYDDMFLDPIALLGADAPRLDMGLVYEFRSLETGSMVEIYSAAAAPSAASVFVPEHTGKRHYQGQGDTAMAISPQDVQQIVEALMQTAPMQWVQQQMAQGGDPNGAPPGPPPGAPPGAPPDGGPMPNAGADPGAMPPGPPPPGMGQPPGMGMPPGQPPKQYAGDDEEEDDYDDEEFTPEDEDDLAGDTAPPKKNYGGHDGRRRKPRRTENYSLSQMRSRITQLEQQAQVERYARVNAERRGYFATKTAEGYPVDIESEMQICSATAMSQQQFELYQRQFEATRQPVPLGHDLPDGTPRDLSPRKNFRYVNGRAEISQYSLEESDRAFLIAQAEAAAGKTPDYQQILEEVHSGKR